MCAKKSTFIRQREHERPGDRSDRAAAPAEEADPAEDDRGDRGEDEDVARGRVAGRRGRGEEQAPGRREHAAEARTRRPSRAHRDAVRPGRLLVVADREDPDRRTSCGAARATATITTPTKTRPHRAVAGWRGSSCRTSGIGAARLRQDLDRQPLVDRERRQRDEDRLQPPVGDEHAVEQPAAGADQRARSSVQASMLPAPSCMCVAATLFERSITRRPRGRCRG